MSGLVIVGVILRLRALLAARSLWLDEVDLASNFRERSYAGLLVEPLAYRQSAPPGFLVASKAFAEIFGTGLVWVRAVPFISSVLVLVVAVLFAHRVFAKSSAQVFFVATMSLSPTLVFYAAETKQYSTDALAVMVALYLASSMRSERTSAVAAMLGFLAIVSSLPGLFVFGVLGLLLLGEASGRDGIRGTLRELRSRWVVFAAWTVGAAVHLAYHSIAGSDRARMQSWWGERGGFAPDRVSGLSEVAWYSERVVEVIWLAFENTRMVVPGTRRVAPLALVAVIALVVLAAQGPRRSQLSARLLGGIALAAWLLAEFELYPLSSRLAIYLIPATLALLALGLEGGRASNSPTVRILAVVSALVLLGGQALTAARQFESPYVGRDMHAALGLLNRQLAPGDAVVTNPAGERIVNWHRSASGFVSPVAVVNPSRIDEDLESKIFAQMRPQRVWIVTTHRQNEAAEIAAALAERYRYFHEFNRDRTYVALVSDGVPFAFAATGDRRLFEVLPEVHEGP